MAMAEKIRGYVSRSSWIRRMFEEGLKLKAQYGPENVYDFSLGNPDVEPPREVQERLQRLVHEVRPGKHGYMPNAGHPETRSALAACLSAQQGVPLAAADIIMTCGAGGALNVVFKTLLDPGEEVVTPTPHFVEYGFYADNAGGVLRPVPTRPDFSLDLAALSQAIGAQTKAVLINSPNNPTGRVYDAPSLSALAELLREKERRLGHPVYLIADEPYREIVYDGVSVPALLPLYRHSIVVSSYSKSLSLPGERIGYIAVHPDIAEREDLLGGLVLCNRILGFVNAPALMQRLVAEVQGVAVEVERYRIRRDLLCEGLAEIGYDFVKPEGAFYLFPRTPIADDVAFVQALQQRRVLVVPGSGFGGPGHFRIAYCVEEKTIRGAMPGFREAYEEFAATR